ncbi:ABC transporter permease [Mycetocola zhadangensis]|uniref:ABC transporter permease n=1 Tax=Mycetocola zhadangensis TaxID=1164595 RepID=A0A3L7IWJ4_9MICO|nr:ABC transporter permease [Mycetocola zhadangensis]RLQ82586.1 ABC transporter permease [Mycetocola zhadangensis]GGF00054.1 nitrate ABC transporter permease [Mycetocola zhadangensis]
MKTLTNILWWLWLPVVLVILWWFASAQSTNLFVPPLQKIVESTIRDFGNGLLLTAMATSLVNLVLGLLIAILFGVIFGLIIGETRRLRLILDPFIHFFRSVPQSALVPLIIGAFGIGAEPKIYAVAFACVWPIMLNTIDGTRSVEVGVRQVSRVFGIPKMLYFRRVVLPGAMPQIVAGVRVALPIGIVVMVVSELFASNMGLGFYILNSSSTFRIPETWGGAMLVGVIGYFLVMVFSLFEKRLLSWYFKSAAR